MPFTTKQPVLSQAPERRKVTLPIHCNASFSVLYMWWISLNGRDPFSSCGHYINTRNSSNLNRPRLFHLEHAYKTLKAMRFGHLPSEFSGFGFQVSPAKAPPFNWTRVISFDFYVVHGFTGFAST